MKRTITALSLAAATMLSMTQPASAHHSFAATYDQRTLTVSGDVLIYAFRNPHALIELLVFGKDKQPQRWTIEWASAAQLGDKSVNSNSLRPGDYVIIT